MASRSPTLYCRQKSYAAAPPELCKPYEIRRVGAPLTLAFRPYSGTPVMPLRRAIQFQVQCVDDVAAVIPLSTALG